MSPFPSAQHKRFISRNIEKTALLFHGDGDDSESVDITQLNLPSVFPLLPQCTQVCLNFNNNGQASCPNRNWEHSKNVKWKITASLTSTFFLLMTKGLEVAASSALLCQQVVNDFVTWKQDSETHFITISKLLAWPIFDFFRTKATEARGYVTHAEM